MWFRFSIFALLPGLVWTLAAAGDAPLTDGNPPFLEFCDWTGQDQELLQDLSDGSLDQQPLLAAALTAGGNAPEQVQQLVTQFTSQTRQFRARVPIGPVTNDGQIQRMFTHLRQKYLFGDYEPDLCDAGRTITQGTFNCLTATILWQALCQECNVSAAAIWEPAHVRCWVFSGVGQTGYLVETTATTPGAAVSHRMPQHEVTERMLTTEQLLGKVFYNHGVQLLRQEAFPQALSSTWAGCVLDAGDQPAQNNLRACLNNWALSVSQRRGDFAFAKRLLDAGLQLDPHYEPFSRNLRLLQDH